MLKELRLNNIVLVESACIAFSSGFNVLSGESGAGKSAIINALNLLAGDRSDSSVVRRGAEKGIVEASFEIETATLLALLEQSGIDHEPGTELILRREISTAGKSRAFINNQLAQLTLLRQVSALLFDLIGQHANQKLLSLEYHRHALDLFTQIASDIATFADCWKEENATRQLLEQLITSETQRQRDIEVCQKEIEELEAAQLKEGEEDTIFAEYTQLTNAEEIAQKASDLTRVLTGEKGAVLTQLSRQKNLFEQLVRLVPALQETATLYDNALVELHEVAHTLRQFESRLEPNPERAEELNDRLELINRLKRKYGPTIEEVQVYLKLSQAKLARLENADIEIEDLQIKLKTLSEKSQSLATRLTAKRKQAAKKFEAAVVTHLRALNMPKVDFNIEISPQKRNQFGDDKIEFFLTPNVGEHRLSLRECASGGELSRTMLALQTVLTGKENIPTLIFDEIDANIGGETATVVGQKLRDISSQHQVLCITHFPQVAKFASHHLRISKNELEGRTITCVDLLDALSHQQELSRMRGE